VTPSTGIGYWLWDTPDLKAMVEAGAGVTFTDYREGKEDDAELVLVPRAYAEKTIIGKSKASQEAIAYPSMTEIGDYRLHLNTGFTNPITDQLSLNINWVNDYNSNPGANTKKHDMRLTSSIEFSF